jgi:hypothetical protein
MFGESQLYLYTEKRYTQTYLYGGMKMEIENLKGKTKKKVTYSIDAKLLEQFEFMVPLKLRSAAIEQLIREWLQ